MEFEDPQQHHICAPCNREQSLESAFRLPPPSILSFESFSKLRRKVLDMHFRSRSDGSHYPIRGRSLFHNKTREKLYQKNIHYGDKYQAEESVQFANQKWSEYSERSQKVHLLQAMNEARNKARGASHNQRLSESEKEKAHQADMILSKWIEDHKGRYGSEKDFKHNSL